MSYIPPNLKIPKVEEEVSNQNSSNRKFKYYFTESIQRKSKKKFN